METGCSYRLANCNYFIFYINAVREIACFTQTLIRVFLFSLHIFIKRMEGYE